MDEADQRREAMEVAERERKKRVLISRVVLALCIAAGIWLGLLLSKGRAPSQSEKLFDADGLQLTLTSSFVETGDREGYDRAYWSNKVGVFVARDGFDTDSGLTELSAEDYACRFAASEPVQDRNGLPWFQTTVDRDGDQYAALVAVYKGTDAFWRVVFVCKPGNFDNNLESFLTMAEAVKTP